MLVYARLIISHYKAVTTAVISLL